MALLPKIFRKGQIGGVQPHNRIIRSATYEALATETGLSTPKLEKCYCDMAKGGCGMIISGGVFTEQQGRAHIPQLGLINKEQINSVADLIDKVHHYHGLISLQLLHAGGSGNKKVCGEIPGGPSQTAKYNRALTTDEIARIVKSFVDAAQVASSIGADGIQLHAAHGYLLAQFLSPIWNKRTDDYGGSVSKRFEIVRRILGGIREKVPNSFTVTLKINGHDIEPNGITTELGIQNAKLAEQWGADGLEISSGSGRKPYSVMGDMDYDYIFNDPKQRQKMRERCHDIKFVPHFNLEYAKAIKKEVKIPIIAVGGWTTLKEMSDAIDNNDCDFVSLSRPFIRHPHLVSDLKAGRESTCIRCNRCFFATSQRDKPLKCLIPY